jgi:GNAT superfamily N-acetyltransferase
VRDDRPGPPRLRPLTADDVDAAAALSRGEGWPHRPEDWRFALALGEGVAAEAGGRVVGTAVRWLYGDDAASVGHVIVDPAHRGAGLGRRLMSAVLDGLDRRRVALNATEAGLPLYLRLGFAVAGGIDQHQGVLAAPSGGMHAGDLPALRLGDRLRPAGPDDAAALERLDAAATGARRGRLLAAIAAVGRGTVLMRADRPVGFAFARASGRGTVVGPVAAPDAEAALSLIAAAALPHAGTFVRVDVRADAGLGPGLAALGLVRVDGATTMVWGTTAAMPGDGTGYAVANQAFG